MADLTATGLYVSYWLPHIPQWLPEIIALILLLGLNLVAVGLFWRTGILVCSDQGRRHHCIDYRRCLYDLYWLQNKCWSR